MTTEEWDSIDPERIYYQNNILIAEFCGAQICKGEDYDFIENKEYINLLPFWEKDVLESRFIATDHLKYHKSLDYLIHVITKIDNCKGIKEFYLFETALIYAGGINEFSVTGIIDAEHCKGIIEHTGVNKLESVYEGIIKFIKWYTKQITNYEEAI